MKRLVSLLVTLLLIVGMLGGAALAEEAKWDTAKQDEIVLSVMNNYYTKGWYTMAGSDCHRMRSISGQYASKVLKSAQIKQLESLMKAI